MADRTHKRWTLRRVLTRVVVLLALGFVVNVLVAWGFAARPPARGQGLLEQQYIRLGNFTMLDGLPVVEQRGTTYSSLSIRERIGEWSFDMSAALMSLARPTSWSCPGCTKPVNDERLYPVQKSFRRALVLDHAWLSHRCELSKEPFRIERTVRAYGWPLPSIVLASQEEILGDHTMRADLFIVDDVVEPGYAAIWIDGAPSIQLVADGDNIGPFQKRYLTRTAPLLFRFARILPLRPIPVGAAINSIFYATLLATLVYGVGFTRRFIRRRRGRCTRCGYDLLHDYASGCPECGWNKPDAHALAG